MSINIQGIPKAELLLKLYQNARPAGLGFMHQGGAPLTLAEAEERIKTSTYIDYLLGRPLKIELGGDTVDGYLYDRDQGRGETARVVEELRAKYPLQTDATATP